MKKEENKFFYFTKKEITWIIIMIIIFEFIMTLSIGDNEMLIINIRTPLIFLVPILIILTNVIAKKIASWHYSIRIEFEVLKFYRWSYYTRSHLKKPFPIGLVFPFFIAFFTLGIIKPLTFLQFNYKNNKKTRLLKKQGRERRTEINEGDPAYVAAWGVFSLLVLSIIGMIIGFKELAMYPIYYVLWNIIPVSGLDGLKMFFGSILTWAIVLIATLITLGISFIIVF
ncbi:hypothetical protein GOV12_03005 [Candidatus Pacearchaeota archaeon]|nr:hypothetical protein [Candidatus Pacearchaeota archaeon]